MDKSIGRAVFTLFLFLCVLILLFLTLRQGPMARLVPLRVVIPTLALLSIQLVLDLAPELAKRFGRVQKVRFARSEILQEKARVYLTPESPVASRGQRELNMLVWISMILVLIYVFGLAVALPVYTFLYLKGRSGEGWFPSIAMSAGVGGLVQGVFVLMLHVHLYEGAVWNWLGF